MKQSRRNAANQTAKAERKSQGKPALSKYERKTRIVEVKDANA